VRRKVLLYEAKSGYTYRINFLRVQILRRRGKISLFCIARLTLIPNRRQQRSHSCSLSITRPVRFVIGAQTPFLTFFLRLFLESYFPCLPSVSRISIIRCIRRNECTGCPVPILTRAYYHIIQNPQTDIHNHVRAAIWLIIWLAVLVDKRVGECRADY